jgi:hypothetical protein
MYEHVFVSRGGPSYTEDEARNAIEASRSWAESLRRLDLCPSGGAWRVLKKYAALWEISTAHFETEQQRIENLRRKKTSLAEVLVERSTYSRGHLKRRLFSEGLKEPRCEICGQGDVWRGRPMSLILDHINGIRDDHRLENLRIVCPNCAATLETHCGRKNRLSRTERACLRCGISFIPGYAQQKYCSRECGVRWDRSMLRGKPNPSRRKARRPSYERLIAEIEQSGYRAVGRRYGVSDNAVRKWVRFYERQREREEREGDERAEAA